MNQLNEQQLSEIKFVLQNFTHPTLQKDVIALNAFKKAELGAGILRLEFTMPFAWNSGFEALKADTEAKLKQITGANEVKWILNYQIATLKRMGIAFVVNRNNRPIVARAIFTHAQSPQVPETTAPIRTWQSNKAKIKTI